MNILLIDDEAATRDSLTLFIEELGHTVDCATNGLEGINLFEKNNYHLVFTDVSMPKLDGFEFLRRVKKSDKKLVDIVIITGHNTVDNAVTALREGAYDYLQKPVNIAELSVIIERVAEHLSLKMANEELTTRFEETVKERVSETESELEKYRNAYRENVGLSKLSIHSKKLGRVFELADIYHTSPTVPVIIEGETGTGKELLARYIHYGPDIAATPFIAINCGAIPADLFESELFGHESGAFTGSGTTAKKGQFEIAENGTLLLDEIGDMPQALQVKLLRVIEEREFYRIGGVKRHAFNARIMASTNKSLKGEVEENRFRRDLYHRLNVGYIRIPPLRERREEIVPLAYDFLERAAVRHGKKNFKGIDSSAEVFLENLSWPGNVRQLENAIERVVLLNNSPYITLDQLRFLESETMDEPSLPEGQPFTLGSSARGLIPEEGIDLDELVMQLVEEAMVMSGGNKAKAAKLLNISPRTITRRLERRGEE